MSCPTSSSCDFQKPLDVLLREAFVKTGDGCLAFRGESVTDSGECEVLSCEEAQLPTDALLSKIFTTNDEGCTTVRLIFKTP